MITIVETRFLSTGTMTDGSITGRVTEGEYAPKAMGIFISFHILSLYNPDTNTEYLQDDCYTSESG